MTEGLSRAQKRYAKQLDNDIAKVMADPASKRVLVHILDMCGMRGSSFTGNSETFYREGRRAVGIEIVNMLNAAEPFAEATLLYEAVKQRIKNEDNAKQGGSDEE